MFIYKSRPKGVKNKNKLAIESLLEGDGLALRLCMERIAPAPKDQPISFSLSSMQSASDASQAAADVLRAVSDGEVTPIEANSCYGAYRYLHTYSGAHRY